MQLSQWSIRKNSQTKSGVTQVVEEYFDKILSHLQTYIHMSSPIKHSDSMINCLKLWYIWDNK